MEKPLPKDFKLNWYHSWFYNIKNNSESDLLNKINLKYFGDLQDLQIKLLTDINISGYGVKSKPMHYINWLKYNNPLGK